MKFRLCTNPTSKIIFISGAFEQIKLELIHYANSYSGYEKALILYRLYLYIVGLKSCSYELDWPFFGVGIALSRVLLK